MNRQAMVPASLRFTEEMRGHVSFGEEDYARGRKWVLIGSLNLNPRVLPSRG